MTELERAMELREETVAHRRWFHENAEVGLHMPRAVEYVMDTLTRYGLTPRLCGHGVTATLGSGGKCLLLRADMDALPMEEESGEAFAATNGAAHTCGHDFHAAMLLTAAKILKEQESTLRGTVKFMFQPAEEIFKGAADMIAQGILENPTVDAALALHITAGKSPVGSVTYNSSSPMMCSCDGFRITVKGKGGHGAVPQVTVDPIHIGAQLVLALEGLIARESTPSATAVLTIGSFHAGTAPNIIPDTAVLEGTLRCDNKKLREKLVRRLGELTHGTASAWGGSAEVEMLSQVPSLVCDTGLTWKMLRYYQELAIPGIRCAGGVRAAASEDFAEITDRVPGTFLYLSAGFPDGSNQYPAHNPKVRFNEELLPIGSAALAHCAVEWLKDCG